MISPRIHLPLRLQSDRPFYQIKKNWQQFCFLLNFVKSMNDLKQLNFIRQYHFFASTTSIKGPYRFNPLTVTVASYSPDGDPACLVDFIISTCISISMPGKRHLVSLRNRTPIFSNCQLPLKIRFFPLAAAKETTLFQILFLLKEYLYFSVNILSKQKNIKTTHFRSGMHRISILATLGWHLGSVWQKSWQFSGDDMRPKSVKE